MVTAHVEVGKKLFCIEWKNQRKMSVFNAEEDTWEVVALPLSGSSRAGFQFGKLSGKLLLFRLKKRLVTALCCTIRMLHQAGSGKHLR